MSWLWLYITWSTKFVSRLLKTNWWFVACQTVLGSQQHGGWVNREHVHVHNKDLVHVLNNHYLCMSIAAINTCATFCEIHWSTAFPNFCVIVSRCPVHSRCACISMWIRWIRDYGICTCTCVSRSANRCPRNLKFPCVHRTLSLCPHPAPSYCPTLVLEIPCGNLVVEEFEWTCASTWWSEPFILHVLYCQYCSRNGLKIHVLWWKWKLVLRVFCGSVILYVVHWMF